MSILGLKLPTDPFWVKNIVENNIQEILTDHAYCEQKAASNAISLIVHFPEYSDLVQQMSSLAMEEMEHFNRVHLLIIKRGFSLGRERKDNYVKEILSFVRKGQGRDIHLLDRLLFAAMIEARSCERFKVLKDNINDKELADFYFELMKSEAEHYTMFIKLAKKYINPTEVNKRWKEYLDFEAEVIQHYRNKGTIHG